MKNEHLLYMVIGGALAYYLYKNRQQVITPNPVVITESSKDFSVAVPKLSPVASYKGQTSNDFVSNVIATAPGI
jgi:hypothetical protein